MHLALAFAPVVGCCRLKASRVEVYHVRAESTPTTGRLYSVVVARGTCMH